MENMKLVDKAIKLAQHRRIKQGELARMIGVDPARLSEWKKDVGKPSIDHAFRMARLLDVPLDYLADDSLDEPVPVGLSEAERLVLGLVRSMGLDEAHRRLASSPAAGQPVAYDKDVSTYARGMQNFLKPGEPDVLPQPEKTRRRKQGG